MGVSGVMIAEPLHRACNKPNGCYWGYKNTGDSSADHVTCPGQQEPDCQQCETSSNQGPRIAKRGSQHRSNVCEHENLRAIDVSADKQLRAIFPERFSASP